MCDFLTLYFFTLYVFTGVLLFFNLQIISVNTVCMCAARVLPAHFKSSNIDVA